MDIALHCMNILLEPQEKEDKLEKRSRKYFADLQELQKAGLSGKKLWTMTKIRMLIRGIQETNNQPVSTLPGISYLEKCYGMTKEELQGQVEYYKLAIKSCEYESDRPNFEYKLEIAKLALASRFGNASVTKALMGSMVRYFH